ncbi:TRAP transporter large permease [Alteromonas sp. a30]|uniref:TRAP transporter large permease n=1 Tax=Alteromonas sp. a30 TaxID=2730917 RepID=UPI002281803B|nr:TRAP transporter large permease subunit [Alteromonas sp. a30]MCY7295151.1 TRAP transporter large permease subunit [Alteromonas sp. a30]
MLLALVLSIVFVALLGMPLFIAILAIAMVGFHFADIDLMVIAIDLYRIVQTPLLEAIPLFTFAGYLLSASHSSQRLVRVTQALLGWLPGGLAIVALIACALFTAFTGASGVTIVALGALLYPALKQAGYNGRFSLGLVTSSGSLGLLFPPSLPLILFGVIALQMEIPVAMSIEDLLVAGLLPGLLMIALLALWSILGQGGKTPSTQPFSWQEVSQSIKEAKWEIPLPLILLGGIYSGIFALSEAAVVTVIYLLIVEVWVYKDIKLKQLPELVSEAMVMVGGILVILASSLVLTSYFIEIEAPTALFDWVTQHIESPLSFLLILNVFLLVLGAFLDIFSAIVIMVPLLLPIAASFGVHPVHLGIIFLANMQIGYMTPPVGMNLFIASYRFGKPITEIYRSTIGFMLVLLLALAVITYWPQLSLVFVS